MKDLVSIIIPIYNSEQYLKECLNSIIKQTYKKLEIILVLDGSNDSSKKIAYEYKNMDKRIKIIDRENKGALYSRIEGAKKATGKYITFIDSDDYIEKNYVEILYNGLISNNVDIVRCHYKILKNNKFYNEKRVVESNKIYDKDKSFDYIYELLYNSIYFNSMCRQLVKKTLFDTIDIDNLDFSINYGEDLLCEIELINRIKSIMIIPDYLYIYNQNESSVTFSIKEETIIKKIDSVCKVNYEMYNNIHKEKINNDNLYKMITIKFFYNLLNQYINLIKYNGDYNYINKIYNNSMYNCFFNEKIDDKYLKDYNIVYKIGIKYLKNKETKKLVFFIKKVIIPLLKLKSLIRG